MSNVLIGIIGVILFIGLALAGALFLGPRFQDATNRSKAAAVQAQLKQVVDAASMSRLKTGRAVLVGEVGIYSPLMPRFLKTPPTNPIRAGASYFLLDDTGGQIAGSEAAIAVAYLNRDEVSQRICEDIDRAAGRTRPGQTFDATTRPLVAASMPGITGCQWNGSAFIVFHKL
jgi:hypothetical protein